MNTKRWAALGIPLVAATLLTAGAPAMASTDDRGGVENSGSCSGTSSWDLKAKTDDGGIEVEFEVDSNIVGQQWKVRISDNGTRVFKGQRTTQGPSGSFSVERIVTNQAGADHFVGFAKNPATGETCRGAVTLG